MKLSENVIHFFQRQGYVIVSTFDARGKIHCSAKGIVGLEKDGRVFIVDLFLSNTFDNIKRNPTVSITAVDEKRFMGYTLQGEGKIVKKEDISKHIAQAWEEKITARISRRIVESVQSGMKSKRHHEADLPVHPKYLIEVDVKHIIDLAPPYLRKS